jgi:transcriptional regulator with XRE-family HTH domain
MSEKSRLIDKLRQNGRVREAYVRSKVTTNVASQIRALRRRQGQTQQEFAQTVEMKQSRVSAMERPETSLNIDTLVRVAGALKLGLIVKFCSFNDMVNWENSFSQDTFDALDLDEDIDFQREESPERQTTTTRQYATPDIGNSSHPEYEDNATNPFPFNQETLYARYGN